MIRAPDNKSQNILSFVILFICNLNVCSHILAAEIFKYFKLRLNKYWLVGSGATFPFILFILIRLIFHLLLLLRFLLLLLLLILLLLLLFLLYLVLHLLLYIDGRGAWIVVWWGGAGREPLSKHKRI